MATEVRRRRGTTDQHNGTNGEVGFTGAVAELTVDLDKDTVVVHDGESLGGFPLLREDLSNVPTTAPFTNISLDTAIFDTTYTETGSETQGTLYWNSDEETLSLVTNGSTLELGHKTELHVKVTQTGGVSKGDVVAATGAVGSSGKIEVQKFSAGTSTTKTIVGIMDEDVVQGEFGKAIAFGKIRGLDMSAFSEGDILYASTTAGELTDTEPSAGNVSLPIAYVVDNSVNTGEIFVRVTPIDENAYQDYDAGLTDIAGLTPTDSNIIVGDGTNWVAESGATARASLGLTIGTHVQAWDAQLDEIAALTPTDGVFIVGNGTSFVSESGNTARTSLGLGTGDSPTFTDVTLTGVLNTNEINTQSDLVWSTSTEVFSTSDYYIAGSLNIASSVYITDELDVAESLRVGTTLDVTGNTTLGGTLSVSGNSTLSGTLGVAGAVTLNSTVQVDGTATINDDIETADFASWFTTTPTGWQISQSGVGDFRTLYIDELVAKAFTADVAQALAGTDILTKSVAKLYDSFVVPAVSSSVTITVEDLEGLDGLQVFESGDHVRCRVVDSTSGLSILDVYGTVSNYSDNTDGTQDWDYTITYAGALNAAVGQTVNKGNILLDYGTSGDYYIERTVLDRSSGTDFTKVPYDRIVQWTNTISGSPRAGDPDTNISVITQSGNLANLTSTYSNVTGFGFFGENTFLTGALLIGDLSKATNYLEYNGTALNVVTDTFDLDATTILLSSSGAGKIALGTDADNILPNDGVGFYADGSGNFLVGSIGQGSDSYISFDGSDLTIETATFTLETTNLSIDSANEVITLGSGTTVTVGKIDANNFGLSLDTHNFWKVSFGEYFFKVGSATNFISFDTSSETLDIETDTFDLDATTLVIDSGTNNGKIALGSTPPTTYNSGTGIYFDGTGKALIGNAAGNKIQFDGTNIDMQSTSFSLSGDGIDIDTAGAGIASPNPTQTQSNLSVDFKSATSGSPVISSDVDLIESERVRVLQIVFDYDISGGDAAYDIRIVPQFRDSSSGTWSNPAMNLPIITYPSTANSYFNTSPLTATLSDESTGSTTEFKILGGITSITDKVSIYIAADPNSIDYNTYDAFRFIAYHQGGAEVTGSFTADMYVRKYCPSTALNPEGFTIRQSDTIYQETVIMQDKLPIRQDKSLLFV